MTAMPRSRPTASPPRPRRGVALCHARSSRNPSSQKREPKLKRKSSSLSKSSFLTACAKLIRIGLDTLRVIGRGTAGVRLFNVAEGEHIVSAVRLDEEEAPENDAEEAVVEEMVERQGGGDETSPDNPPTRDEAPDDEGA